MKYINTYIYQPNYRYERSYRPQTTQVKSLKLYLGGVIKGKENLKVLSQKQEVAKNWHSMSVISDRGRLSMRTLGISKPSWATK